jgi:hypothetical protein
MQYLLAVEVQNGFTAPDVGHGHVHMLVEATL